MSSPNHSRAPVPPHLASSSKNIHRNPNLVAKLASEQSNGVNPLLARLYSSSLPPQPGQAPAGVPNILSSSAKKPEPLPIQEKAALEEKAAKTAGSTMQVYTQPVLKEAELRQMLNNPQPNKMGTVPLRRQTPPSRLEPLETALVTTSSAVGTSSKLTRPAEKTTTTSSSHAVEEDKSSPLHVVSRFRTSTANTPKEFTYLTMRPRGIRDLYNPYDLMPLNHNEVDPAHYFTVSAAGVTKFDDGEAEFIDLKAWEREFHIYHKLVKLDVFKKYKKWKSFHVWRKLVRRTTIQNYKNFLNDNLFHLHPDLSKPLHEIRKTCLSFQSWSMYQPAGEVRTLDNYCRDLHKHLDYQKAGLATTMKDIKDIIEKACKEAMLTSAQARERELQHGAHVADEVRKRAGRRTGEVRDGGSHKPSYIELSQKRAVCRRLTNYIRLCDYMVINSLVTLAMKAVRDANVDLAYPRPELPPPPPVDEKEAKKRGHATKKAAEEAGPYQGMIFAANVEFSPQDEAIAVHPSMSSFTQDVEDLISDYVNTVCEIPRLAQEEVFKVYTEQGMMEHAGDGDVGFGPNVTEMITQEEDYKKLTRGIRTSITTAFQEVEGYAHKFEPFRIIYLDNIRLNPDEIKEADPPLDWFREQLEKYKNQSEQIDAIVPMRDVAIFCVHTEKMREFFMPSPKDCLAAFHALLPVIAREKNTALSGELESTNEYLGKTPETVEEYVKYTDYFENLDNRFPIISTEFDCLRELFTLLDLEKIEISQDDTQAYHTFTRPGFDKLRNLMQTVEDGRDSQVQYFIRNIDQQLDDLQTRMKAVVRRAQDPVIANDDACNDPEQLEKVINLVKELQAETDAICQREKELTRFQESFKHDPTPIDELRETVAPDISHKVKLWTSLQQWDQLTQEWSQTPFVKLEPASVNEQINKYSTIAKQVSRTQTQNLAVPKLRGNVEEWRSIYPMIQALKNPKIKDHHQTELNEVIGKIPDANGIERNLSEIVDYTLGMLLDNNILHVKDDVLRISLMATEEFKLDQMLQKVSQIWTGGDGRQPMEFVCNKHKDQDGLFVLSGTSVEDVTAQLEDSLIVVSTIASSKYCTGGLKQYVDKWEDELRYMQDTLDKWLEFQRNWMYLENIFSAPEIRSQWKADAKTFETVNHVFKDLMRQVNTLGSAYQSLLMYNKGLQAQFERDNKQLEKVLNSLERKLEEKRRSFPRFYFLSNDDLLDILAKIKKPELITPHMLKMFDGIKMLTLSPSNDITHLNSIEGERVELEHKTIKTGRGQVEQWLGQLEKEMFYTLRKLAKVAVDDYETRNDRTSWIFQHPVQLVLIVSMIYWSAGVQEALKGTNAKEKMKANRDLNYKMLADLAGVTGRKLSRVQRAALSTLITLDVHGRDLVDEMVDNGVVEDTDFGWTKQLRCYWEDDTDGEKNVFIQQNNSRFVYGYEYLGAQGRLVITPLTDRIYMTITGALYLNLGAAPAGPAGTGKTETTKDLAKNLARQCIVYNCSDGVTYKMMEKFFSGLIQTGAWTCLDEFNRINIEVLSVIASQVLEIKQALENPTLQTFTFQGTPNVPIRRTYGAFITMNPGYAGRTELPDNLKILFRPVAVMTPDFRMIAEVILYSEGFKDAKDLSLKITQLYKLSSEQLSPQDHYDFGMRALKSILVMAGDLKRSQPDVDENLTLIVACNDANLPKFVADDIPLFRGIMQDLFPGVSFPEREYTELLPAIERDTKKKKLMNVPAWINKGIQFYETLIVRHGVMLVGVTGTGKTETRNVIANALIEMAQNGSSDKMAQPVHQFVMNPKSIMMHELYGQLDVMTNEWRDGVLAVVAKNCVRESEESTDHRWIVFDGPVDTLWIESLNSVLDDSKLLCLDSGERIKLPDTIHMLFEVGDLSQASPATVSRCGMVYVDASDLSWEAPVYNWKETTLAKLGPGPQCRDFIVSLFDKYIPQGLAWLRTQTSVLIDGGEQNIVVSCAELFSSIMKSEDLKFAADPPGDTVLKPDDAHFKDRNDLASLLFAFCFVWSVGGNVDSNSQDNFDAFCRDLMESVPFPSHGTVFDFMLDFQTRKFISWETKIKPFEYTSAVPFFEIIVPTADTMRYSYLAKTCIANNKPVLFSGYSGVGKSVIMNDCLSVNKETLKLVLVIFQFSAQTSSSRTQELIESKLHKTRKNILGAPPERHVVLFIDDLNMPALEKFGASPPVELLRQMMGNRGFYDRKVAGFWKTVQGVTTVAACGPPEGGRNPVTKRLTRMFHLLQIPNLSEESMKKIFLSILNGFFDEKGFAQEVRDLSKSMINGSVEIFQRLVTDLRPRPATPHYTFNLRDLAKVCQGLMQVTPRICNNTNAATRLWIHENLRCFYDRLATDEDRLFFSEQVAMDAIKRLFPGNWNHQDLFEGQPLIWGDFLRFGAAAEDRMYEEVTDFQKMYKLFDEYLDDYNATVTANSAKEGVQSSSMNLVFFRDHCEHLARIIRIIRQPRGNALLVGVGGSGKRSLTRLATSIAEYRRFEIAVGKGYSMDMFHESLLELYNTAGIKCQPMVFLLSDTQMVHPGMLEDINNILNSGEVPSLFPPDERDKKINACMEAAREAGFTHRDEIWNFFISRVRDNMHIVLCMSPVGEAFRTRCRQFPSLTNCCSIDWFNEWPMEALSAVAERTLGEIDFGTNSDMKEPLQKLCPEIHRGVVATADEFWDELRRRYYITPTSYLEFLNLFRSMLDDKTREISEQLQRLQTGKAKMKTTNASIELMRKQLEDKQPLLEKASKENEVLLADLQVRREKASVVQITVASQKTDAAEQKRQADEIEADAQEQLDQALPEVRAAEKALDSIDKGQLTELKALKNPPPAVLKTLQATMTMFEGRPEITWWNGGMDWNGAKEFLGDPGSMLNKLQNYDRDNVRPQNIARVQKFLNDEEFTPEIMGSKGSAACKGLCIWVRAINKYAEVAKAVAPKRAALASAKAAAAETEEKLASAEAALKAVEDELDALQKGLEESNRRKELLEQEVKTCEKRLINAESLTGSLKNEAVRWDQNILELEARLKILPVEVFMSCACIAYFGAFTPRFRKRLVNLWCEKVRAGGLALEELFSLVDACGDRMEIMSWRICSLPTDETSTENAIIVSMSSMPRRWPLLIDPQGQATKWITQKDRKEKSLKIVKFTDSNYLRTVELAIRNGYSVLIDDVGETLDPALEPLLQRQVFQTEGSGYQIILNQQTGAIPYDPNFRLYICTKLSNPHYLPDVSIKVTLVNFTVTKDGLEDQMLGEVVAIEQRALEEKNNEITREISAGQKQLKTMEERILKGLNEAKGEILDNSELVENLKQTQKGAAMVQKKQDEATQKIAEITQTREMYRTVANRSSILFFVLADFALIDPMYQYSLDFYKRLVANVIETTPKPDGFDISVVELFDQRISDLLENISQATYTQICRGLFNRDKTILSLLMCTSIARSAGDIAEPEWQYFVRAGALVASEVPEIPETCDWISPQQWELIEALNRTVPSFKGFMEDVKSRPNLWKIWAQKSDPHLEILPGGGTTPEDSDGRDWENQLTKFQRILLIRCWREEKVYFALQHYVSSVMGKSYIEPPAFNLEKAHADSNPGTPIVFILSPGSDPMDLMRKLAKDNGKQLQTLSLGQGQGENAKKLIESCKKSGDWAMLQNCHLSKSFMPDLENAVALLNSPQAQQPDKEFRLWLTSMPTDFFPVYVLQNSIKLTNEAPTGIKANLVRCYGNTSHAEIEAFEAGEDFPDCSKEYAYKKLLYSLCFFHSIILERKKFGPLGWNSKYEWNDTDFDVARQWLKVLMKEQAVIPYDSLEYIIGQIVYGGRVTDPIDRISLQIILRNYLNSAILHEGYSYSASGKYRAPSNGSPEHYQAFIGELPLNDDPEVFGMHENANLRFQLQNTQALMNTVLSIQPRLIGSKGGGPSPEEQVAQKCRDFEELLPANISRDEAGPTAFTTLANGLPNSLSTVLSHELVKYNKLLTRIRGSLADMQKALKGLTVLSEDLDKMYVSFLNDQVPLLWSSISYISLKPLGAWFKELVQKIAFIRGWVKHGEPDSFWLPGFFNAAGFMTGALQAFARASLTSVDKLGFSFTILNAEAQDITEKPPAGVYIHGINTDSWRWDKEKELMADSLPGEPYAQLPVVHFLPEAHHKLQKGYHKIPMYRTTIRAGVISSLGASSNYIMPIEAPTDKEPDYWVLKGAACVAALNF